MSAYSLEITNDIGNPEWGTLLKEVTNCHFRQYPEWALAKKAIGYDSRLLLVRQNNVLAGGALVLIRKYAYWCRIGIVSQGPCLKDENAELVAFFSRKLTEFCSQFGLLYLIVELPYSKSGWLNLFLKNGFAIKAQGLPGGFLYDTTLMINLDREVDEIFSGFSSARRRYVRKSSTLPVVLREGELEDLDACCKLFSYTSNKRSGYLVEPYKSFYQVLLGVPKQDRKVLLLIGEVEGEMVSASFCLLSGDVFMHYIWGWSGRYADQHYTDAVYWQMIQLAKEKGFRFFDFVQVDDAVASAVLSGSPLDNSVRSRSFFGPTFYKMSFGGQKVQTPGILCYFPSMLYRVLFGRMVPAFLKSQFLRKMKSLMTPLFSFR